jgi:hypothetical protein
VWEVFTRPSTANTPTNAVLGLSLISAFVLVPWLLVSGVGFLVGFGLRRVVPRAPEPDPPRSAQPAAAPPAPAPIPRPPSPPASEVRQTPSPDDLKPPAAVELSPDGTIRVDFDWVEWRNSQWVRTPRVTDLVSGAVVLNLWGSDWDATAVFPQARVVRLQMTRFHFGGWVVAEIDLDAQLYRILSAANQEAPAPPAPLAELAEGLQAWWAEFARTAPPRRLLKQNRFAAWRTALVILLGALATIGAAAVLLSRQEAAHHRKAPLATVPALRR